MPFTPPPRVTFGKPAQQPAPERLTPAKVRAETRRHHEAKLAADLLPELPDEGEALHTLMSGRYDLAQVIAATVRRWPVSHLRVATLSANKRTLRELVNELEAGTVARLSLLTSGFFARHNRELFLAFRDEIRDDHPGSVLAFGKSHCKVVVFDFTDGSTPLVFEGSANLRSNDSLEQLAAIRDRPLAEFHRTWIDRLLNACDFSALDSDDDDAE